MPEQSQQSTTSSQGLGAQARETTERLERGAIQRVEQVRQTANQKKTELAERVRRVGSVVRDAGTRLREEDQFAGRYAGVAADGIERAASYIERADPRTALHDVERFARERPAVFFGGAFLLGLVVGRFVKSSAEHGASTGTEGGWAQQSQEPYEPGEGRYFEQSGYVGQQYQSQRAGLRGQEGIETGEVAGHGATQAGGYPAEQIATPNLDPNLNMNPNPQRGPSR